MIYLGIVKENGKRKIKCKRQDGVVKTYKATKDARIYAKGNLKNGDVVVATFDDETYEITKITKSQRKSYSGGNRGGGSQEMTEMSVYKTVGAIVVGLEGVTKKNVKDVIEELYAQGLELIRGKKAKDNDDSDDNGEDDDDDKGDDNGEDDGNEEE